MPKIVDHDRRRVEIAAALWRVVQRDGLPAASVRTVAQEAGWSTGSIRHYFSTQSELLAFAAQQVIERTTRRVSDRAHSISGVDDLVAIMEAALPVDAESRREAEVWFALVAAARTDPTLKPLAAEAHRRLRKLCSDIVGLIAERRGDDLDRMLETDRLHGLIDGLALQATLYPRAMPTTRLRRAVREHLQRLADRPRGDA